MAANAEGTISKKMVKFAAGLNPESLVVVHGVVQKPKDPVKSATIPELEIHITKLFLVKEAIRMLPIQLEDASRAALDESSTSVEKSSNDEKNKQKESEQEKPVVSISMKLNNPVIAHRTPLNSAIWRIRSGVCQLFREYLYKHDFKEYQTPKLIGAASEGGAEVFEVKYFDRKAYLAQSPQFYKQMLIAGGQEKVFEVGPVFRAENSNTPRHMTEVHYASRTLLGFELTRSIVHWP